jgi:cytochrome c oxidase subunit 1
MLYIIIGLLGGLIGTGLSIIIRIELSDIGQVIITNNQIYNVVITGHALLMIFYFIMPSLIGGFGNIFIPIQIGALDMAFPRLNNVSL